MSLEGAGRRLTACIWLNLAADGHNTPSKTGTAHGTRDRGRGTRDTGQGTRDMGPGTWDMGHGTRQIQELFLWMIQELLLGDKNPTFPRILTK